MREVAGDRVTVSPAADGDLRAIAAAAREPGAGIVVLPGDIVTHGEALAGLLKDPRVATGALLGGGWLTRAVRVPGALQARARDQRRLALPLRPPARPARSSGSSRSRPPTAPRWPSPPARLAELTAAPPEDWQRGAGPQGEHVARRAVARQRSPTTTARRREGDDEPAEDLRGRAGRGGAHLPRTSCSSPTTRRSCARGSPRRPTTPPRCCSSGSSARAPTSASADLRKLFWARPLSTDAVAEAAERDPRLRRGHGRCSSRRSRRTDGFFTTFFVSPYSRYIARWCAHRGFTPNQVTTVSLFIGALAAAGVRDRRALGAGRRARSCCRSRSRPTASTASSPATRARSPSSAPGWTRSSTARRSTWRSPAWRSARAAPATRCGCWRARR